MGQRQPASHRIGALYTRGRWVWLDFACAVSFGGEGNGGKRVSNQQVEAFTS